ncbi:MAG: ParB/RepB/Spo0J family partition protein [Clostridia bacterium]|nr:ParB/RepB/Spo0J family partition protein [Clostridia bacterium]
MTKIQKGLGKGFSALFSQTQEDFNRNASVEVFAEEYEKAGDVLQLNIADVYPNPDQPRKTFDDSSLAELADSISEHGVIMPVVVHKTENGKFMIIAGERRWRASRIAGKKTIPAIVKNYTDKQIKEVSLIENLQREDLNPIEAALAMRQLMEDYGMTQENLAERLGKSRSTIANTLRLLQLSPEVIKMISDGRLSAGHARALISLPDSEQFTTAVYAVNNGLSVRDVEQKVRDYFNPPEIIKKQKREKMLRQSVELRDLIDRMQRAFGTKVSAIGNDNKGRIYIDYYTRDDLDRLSDIVELAENKKD